MEQAAPTTGTEHHNRHRAPQPAQSTTTGTEHHNRHRVPQPARSTTTGTEHHNRHGALQPARGTTTDTEHYNIPYQTVQSCIEHQRSQNSSEETVREQICCDNADVLQRNSTWN